MTLQFSTVELLTRQHGVKFVVYGKPKLGKTTLIGTCPRPIIFSAERGLLSLRNNPSTRDTPAAEIHSVADFMEARDWCLQSNEAKNYDTFCLDSISEIAEVCLIEEKAKTLASTEKGKKPNGFEPYMALSTTITSILREFRDLTQKHVYFIAKEEWDKDGDTGISMFRPTMPGRELTKQLPYLFDEIFQLCRFNTPEGAPYNALRTVSDSQNTAGDRSGILNSWEEADLGKIIKKILGA